MTEEKDKPKTKGELVVSTLLPKMPDLTMSALQLPPAATLAKTGSVAVTGDNLGSILNINAKNLTIVERQIARELPSYLSNVVARFSDNWSEYNSGSKRPLPPEVSVKLAYNDFPPAHYIITDYLKYSNVLEAAYRGVEQRNDDARRLVRRRAAVAYTQELHKLLTAQSVSHWQAHIFARKNAVPLVMAVVAALMADCIVGSAAQVMEETAHLAVCLIVADAVIECEVLERPVDAATS
ncbi:MAG: hypothetical protein IPO13_14010 [Rhodocyclaceae bacterium]|nr:hypothetical protein [Rhodocyclaceae bacterium]